MIRLVCLDMAGTTVHAPHTHILDSVADLAAVIDEHNGRELRCPPEAR